MMLSRWVSFGLGMGGFDDSPATLHLGMTQRHFYFGQECVPFSTLVRQHKLASDSR